VEKPKTAERLLHLPVTQMYRRDPTDFTTNDISTMTLPDGRHLAVDAFVSDSAANDETRDAIIARLAKAAWDRAQSLGR
jgi:hypothetical protein